VYRLRDKGRYWTKIAIFFIPHIDSTLPLGRTRQNLAIIFRIKKTRMWATIMKSLRTCLAQGRINHSARHAMAQPPPPPTVKGFSVPPRKTRHIGLYARTVHCYMCSVPYVTARYGFYYFLLHQNPFPAGAPPWTHLSLQGWGGKQFPSRLERWTPSPHSAAFDTFKAS